MHPGHANYGSIDQNDSPRNQEPDPINENPDALPQDFSEDMEIEVRHGFIKKVFGILFIQLLATCLLASPFMIYRASLVSTLGGGGIMALSIIAGIVALCVICYMSCYPEAARKFPTNYIFLGVITICMSMTVGTACLHRENGEVMIAAGITCGVSLLLMGFAFQTKYDFTGFGPYLFIGCILLMIFGLITMIFFRNHVARMIYSSIGVVLFSFYLIYDTQLIVGGKHRKYQMSIDDYVFGALALYLDIINLFLHILELVSSR